MAETRYPLALKIWLGCISIGARGIGSSPFFGWPFLYLGLKLPSELTCPLPRFPLERDLPFPLVGHYHGTTCNPPVQQMTNLIQDDQPDTG